MTATSAPKGWSLSTQVVALLSLVTVPLLLGLGWTLLDRNREALTVDAQHHHRLLAERARAALDAELQQARITLESMAGVLISGALTSDDARLELAGAQLRAWGRARFAAVYRPDGVLVGALRTGKGSPPPTLPDTLRQPSFSVGVVLHDTESAMLQLATPALRSGSGEVALWVYAELDLTELAALVRRLGEEPPLRDADAVFVVDAARRVVLAGRVDSIGRSAAEHGLFQALGGHPSFQQPLAVTTDFTEGGQAMMGALTTLPGPGWAVVVQRPRAAAYATLGALKWAVAVAVAAALVLALVSGVVGARRLARPLTALAEAAQRLGRRQEARVEPRLLSRGDEVGQLARAFDTMTGDLASSEARVIKETQTRTALSRFLPAEVVERAVADPSTVRLGGERHTVTVLFADVVGFTRLAEALPPETVVAVLNELFTFATELVHQHGGMVDKFVGDCVMAVWGVPDEKPDDARQALETAQALRRWLDVGNRRWRQRYGVEVQLAMGLHTGPVVAGNVGSERRMDYTVIGDTVNVAAHLESLAGPNQILVSAATRTALGEQSPLELLGERALRGRTQTTLVYEVQP